MQACDRQAAYLNIHKQYNELIFRIPLSNAISTSNDILQPYSPIYRVDILRYAGYVADASNPYTVVVLEINYLFIIQ